MINVMTILDNVCASLVLLAFIATPVKMVFGDTPRTVANHATAQSVILRVTSVTNKPVNANVFREFKATSVNHVHHDGPSSLNKGVVLVESVFTFYLMTLMP